MKHTQENSLDSENYDPQSAFRTRNFMKRTLNNFYISWTISSSAILNFMFWGTSAKKTFFFLDVIMFIESFHVHV